MGDTWDPSRFRNIHLITLGAPFSGHFSLFKPTRTMQCSSVADHPLPNPLYFLQQTETGESAFTSMDALTRAQRRRLLRCIIDEALALINEDFELESLNMENSSPTSLNS